MTVRGEKNKLHFPCCIQQIQSVESNGKVFFHRDIKMIKE